MFLVVAALLSIITWLIAWRVAYYLANPKAPLIFSKTVGWLTGMAAIPTFAASVLCAHFGHSPKAGATFAIVNLVGMIIASPAGENAGKKHKAAA